MMKTTLEVGDLFSVLGAHGIERQLQRVAGVGRVSVNPVSGSTTVLFDPEKASPAVIQQAIEDCGFHCGGEALPRHICEKPAVPEPGPKALISQPKLVHPQTHEDHGALGARPTIFLKTVLTARWPVVTGAKRFVWLASCGRCTRAATGSGSRAFTGLRSPRGA